MTPERLAKIRAIAEDPRADPTTRDVARQMLERFAISDGRHPGLRHTPEYSAWRAAMKKGDGKRRRT